MTFRNLSKTFMYVNAYGESIVFEYAKGFLINKPAGVDTVTVSLAQAQGINQVGATVQSRNIQPRAVNVSGILVGGFQAENKDRLLSVVRPDLAGKLYADDFYLDVYPTSTPSIGPEKAFAPFSFSLLAAYPFWQHDETLKAVLSGLAYRFRLPCNFSRPYKFAEIIETQFINVVNSGQLPVPFTVTFFAKGACSNPKLTNVSTGKYLLIERDMVAGERVVVEITHSKTYVTSSVEGDIRGALLLESNLFELAVGDNVLKPEAASGSDQLEVTIDFATEKVGVSL